MRKQKLLFGIAIVLLLLAFTSADNNVGAEIENEVKTFFESGVKAFNAHNLDSFMNHFHSDFEMYISMTVYPTGEGPAYHGITTGVYVLREGEWGEVLEVEHVTGADEELVPNSQ